ncbi:hypothetical protein DFH08DRAFT_829831 [Mycena albidolilacea]|uniref:Uncharacterized protein n=1 Tax=Mycena albidolilacea TaxID=1033008 RepID=A0AAD7AU43_9AGAR|nr:hypothetical protein DFH08DRAFT_829831 [Mycena albidolilacea]
MPKTPSPTKSPSTPKKKHPSTVWRSPTKTVGTGLLATPNGPSIKRTAAQTKYKVKPTDLDTITPISRQPNPMGGSAPMQIYNECDVAALAQKLRPGKPLPALAPVAGPSSPAGLAKKTGRQIMRSAAAKEFKLTPAQLDQLQPVSMKPNAYGVTRYYNRCDVESLKLRLEGGGSNRLIDFDGVDRGDASTLLMHC